MQSCNGVNDLWTSAKSLVAQWHCLVFPTGDVQVEIPLPTYNVLKKKKKDLWTSHFSCTCNTILLNKYSLKKIIHGKNFPPSWGPREKSYFSGNIYLPNTFPRKRMRSSIRRILIQGSYLKVLLLLEVQDVRPSPFLLILVKYRR